MKVTGTYGAPGTVTGKVYGPLAPKNGSCEGLDWKGAPVLGDIAALKTKGDGTYTTAPITTKGAGCYTFVESLTLDGKNVRVTNTKPGEKSETVLFTAPPAAPVAPKQAPVAPAPKAPAPAPQAPVEKVEAGQAAQPVSATSGGIEAGVPGTFSNDSTRGAGLGAIAMGLLSVVGLGSRRLRRN